MNKLIKKEDGFGTVEAILALVIIGVISFAGWWVYKTQKDTNKTLTDTAQGTGEAQKSTKNTSKNEPTATPINYFEIKELGVKFDQGQNLKGLYYTIGNNNKTAYFSLADLKATDCAADKTSQVALTRYTDADFNEDVQAAASKDSAKKIGNYYYFVASGQAMCSEDTTIQEKASNMKIEIVKLVPSTLTLIK